MGKGKQWTPTECKHVAEAWIEVSEDQDQDTVKGANQDGDEFWDRVYTRFTLKGSADGCYGMRSLSAVRNYWTDNIARDCKRFNKSLVLVYASRPTGVSIEQKINIAVALHLKKADTASSRHRDFPPGDWKFYEAWLVLKEHRGFRPPSQEQIEDQVELDDDDDDELPDAEGTGGEDSNSTPSDLSGNEGRRLFTPGANVSVSVSNGTKNKSRGPGPGARKTKKLAEEAEYRKKKTKMQETMLQLASQRQKDFAMYVHNSAKAQAWKMAMDGYNAFKDSDEERAEQYKQQLDRIMFGDDKEDNNNGN